MGACSSVVVGLVPTQGMQASSNNIFKPIWGSFRQSLTALLRLLVKVKTRQFSALLASLLSFTAFSFESNTANVQTASRLEPELKLRYCLQDLDSNSCQDMLALLQQEPAVLLFVWRSSHARTDLMRSQKHSDTARSLHWVNRFSSLLSIAGLKADFLLLKTERRSERCWGTTTASTFI